MMHRRILPSFVAVLPVLAQAPAPAPAADPFAPLRFLVGRWQGEDAKGVPGKGSGEFTLRPELGGKVLVRRNVADYPAQNGRPAVHHEDLTTVYPERGELKALYVDNEGHAIHYTVAAAPGGDGAVLLSEGPGPRFRLSYLKQGADRIAIRFEIAPPGKDFATYLEAGARRVKE